jgi:hypothetical protein
VKQLILSDHFGIFAKLLVTDIEAVLAKHASAALGGRHDSQNNDTQHNNIQHYDT